jgi:RNA polymerase sigma factor (sigma-70 family)
MLRLLDSGPDSPRAVSVDKSPGTHDALRSLVAKASVGERAAQRTLLCAVGPHVLRVVRGVLGVHHPDVEDVFQEASLALLSALPRFRGESTTVHFACRVAVLTAMNARRRVRNMKLTDGDPGQAASGGSSPAESAEQARRREALREVIDELPPARAEVLVLHVMLGYTVEEASLALGVPVNTVRSRLRRALGNLRDRVQTDRRLLELIRGGHEA